MPLPNEPWSTNYPADQDTGTNGSDQMPDLDNDSTPGAGDGNRVLKEHPEALRNKLHAVCLKVGDDNDLPVGSLGARVNALEATSGTDENVKVTINDTTQDFLNEKVNPTNGLQKAVGTPSGDETLDISPVYGSSANTVCQGNDSRLSDARTPTSHNTSHQSGGGDAIKLDDLSAPDDNTDLDATTGAHGLLPKLGGGTTNFLRADGAWAAPAGGGASPLTTKGDLYTYDTADARLPVGANGTVLTADDTESLGVKWEEPVSESVGFSGYEKEFTAVGGDENFALVTTPAINTDMLSGYNILSVTRNGAKLRYQSSPTTSLEYGYNSGTNEIVCKSLTAGDIITVIYADVNPNNNYLISQGVESSISGTFTNYTESQTADGSTWYPVLIDGSSTNLEETITVSEGENIVVSAYLNVKPQNTTSNNDYIIVAVFIDSESSERFRIGSCSGVATVNHHHNLSGTKVIEGLASGSHTIKLKYKKYSGTTYNVRFTDGQLSYERIKGGYVQKENEPVLGTFSGDTVTLVAAPGASNKSYLVLNDGVQYSATLPLTLDLTTTGEGGREASKSAPSGIDHWFAYAIPSSVSGQWNVIGTTKSPGDGGPDDYSVWKYLHPLIRYDGTEGQPTGLIPMFVGADGWYVLEQRLVLTEIKALVTWTAKSNINVPELPQSADQAMVNFFFQATANAAGDRSIFRWYKDTSATEDYLFTTQQNNVSGQTSDQTECGIIRLAEGTTNRCAIAVEQITGTPVFVAARAHVLRFTDRYKRGGNDASPRIASGSDYIYTDEFNDSSLNSVWSEGSGGDGGGSAVEGTDGLTISVGSGTVNSFYQVVLSLADFPDMHMRNWEISVHVEYTGGTPDDTSRAEIILNGIAEGSNKAASIMFTKHVATTALEAGDNGGSEFKNLGGTGVNECWMRLRKYGDEIRTDYYLGANTVDVYGDGYWRQYDSAKNWQVVMPDSGSLEIPHKYNLIRLQVLNYDNKPAVSYKFSKFRFRIV